MADGYVGELRAYGCWVHLGVADRLAPLLQQLLGAELPYRLRAAGMAVRAARCRPPRRSCCGRGVRCGLCCGGPTNWG